MWRRRRSLVKARKYTILITLGIVALLSLCSYFIESLVPSSLERFRVAEKSVDRVQTWNKSSRNRFRALCDSQPIVSWSQAHQLWFPPVCPYVLIYFGDEPTRLTGTGEVAQMRALVKSKLGSDAYHIQVHDKTDFSTLGQLAGSDLLERQWPSILLLEQHSGNKYLFTTSEGEVAREFGEFLVESKSGRRPQFLRQEHLEGLSLKGGTSAEQAPMAINSEFFEKYIGSGAWDLLEEKELFVVFHAPWCGHCRVFLSKFEPIARQILLKSGGRGLGFYKIDVTANDLSNPRFRFNQVPTTLFFKQGNLLPLEFDERKNVKEGLVSFLKTNSHALRQKDFNEL